MKGIFHWFKASTKMKRWILLILIGIILACYGMAEVLVLKEVSFEEVAKIVGVFVVGFTFIVIGLICINKRTLELLVEATDDRMEKKSRVNVNSLIFNKKVYNEGPKIVVIGGGTGLNTVLSGIKKYTNNVTAIVAVSSYGKKPTHSREALHILPMEDIRDSIIALSSDENAVWNLMNYEYVESGLEGLTFADLYFDAMKKINGEFTKSVSNSDKIFNMIGHVLPVTLDEMKICAELANGYIVEEKDRIPEVVYDKVTKINRMFLNPGNCRPAPGVLEAIKEADSIVIGPGSLYTNVIPNLLVNGVAKAIKESSAIKIYISNIMTEPGQTDEFSISDHIRAIVEHCGEGLIDYCIYDTGEVIPEFIKMYNKKGADLVEQDIDVAKTQFRGIKFLPKNLSVITDDFVRHDANLVASSVIELICDDLKYQDKQTDPQYVMMATKLKEDKKLNKKRMATEKSRRKARRDGKKKPNRFKTGKKSKFSAKYSERIASIKESSQKTKIKRKPRTRVDLQKEMEEKLKQSKFKF